MAYPGTRRTPEGIITALGTSNYQPESAHDDFAVSDDGLFPFN
jgi:hypothetical protein